MQLANNQEINLQISTLLIALEGFCDINSKISTKTWNTIIFKLQTGAELLPSERSLLDIANAIDVKLNKAFKDSYGITVFDKSLKEDLPSLLVDRLMRYQNILSDKIKVYFPEIN